MKGIMVGVLPVGRRIGAAAALVPGMFLLGIGAMALFAPKLLATVAAIFFLYVGAMVMFLGWKILQWRRKALAFMEQLNGKVEFHRDFSSRDFSSRDFEGSDSELHDIEVEEYTQTVIEPDGGSAETIDTRKIIVH